MLAACTANLMALIAGAMVVLALTRFTIGAASAGLAAGLGYVLGLGLAGLMLWLAVSFGSAEPLSATAGGLTLATILAGGIYLWRPRRVAKVAAGALRGWRLAAWVTLTALLALNALLLLAEIQVREVYPWDAWSAWSVKAKVWVMLNPGIDFVSFERWLSAPVGTVYTNEAWHYPELTPLIQLWSAGWAGVWHDPLALLPWGLLYPALLLAAYCGLRLLGTMSLVAMTVTYLIGSIPILGAQIGLAGYADVWIAAELLLFALCATLYLEGSGRGLLIAALALLGMAAATKLEGLAWALLCLPVITLPALSARVRMMLLAVAVVAVALLLAGGGIELTLPGGSPLVLSPDRVELPYLGAHELEFSNQFGPFVRAFLLLPNWHLVWYLLVPCGLWIAYAGRRERAGQALSLYLSVGLGFLFVLFFMTGAGVWTERMTTPNRLALQFVPAAVWWVGLLLARRADPA